MLVLPVEIARYAEQRQELARRKKLPTHEDLHPNTKFVENEAIRRLADSDADGDYVASRKLGWARNPELIRTLYNRLIETDYYKSYRASLNPVPEGGRAAARAIFRFRAQECDALDEALDEQS